MALNVEQNADQIAEGLGWFSLGLGLAELLAPQVVADIAGIKLKHTLFVRVMGLREIGHGLAIFSQGTKPAGAVWTRVAGDALDLLALTGAFLSPVSNKMKVLAATANFAGITALDVATATRLSIERGSLNENGTINVQRSIQINRSPHELYELWHNFDRLPQFMRHVVAVSTTDDGLYHWVAEAPGGGTVDWTARVTADKRDTLIAWRSLPESAVQNSGSVRFQPAPAGRGTIVSVEMEYRPPAGLLGAAVAKLMREDPDADLKDDLRRFKQIAETGEVMRSDASPQGSGNLMQCPAQPEQAA